MHVRGNFQTDEIRSNEQNYSLNGKADVVMQNTGETEVKVGNRTLPAGASMRIAGELTILTNQSISIIFNGAGVKQLWVHYIIPFIENDCN